MRQIEPILILVLVGSLAVLPARAQQGQGWVDPPRDKPAPTTTPAPEPSNRTVPASEWVDRDVRSRGQEAAARRLANEYIATISGPELVTSARRFYAERIRFHGRLVSLKALVHDKDRFARRWPQRRYAAVEPARVSCDTAGEACTVRSILRFEAVSERRRRRATGLAELVLTIGFENGEPIIFAETSRVLQRGLASNAEDRIMRAG